MSYDYESPIEVMYKELQTMYEDNVVKAVQEYNITVNKDELLMALQYDRAQYDKGFSDGKADVFNSIVRCGDCEFWSDEPGGTMLPQYHACRRWKITMTADDYCSRAIRREE